VTSRKGEEKMGRLRKVGGEVVEAGTYWNFQTGKKVKIEQKGLLPGGPSHSYYKAPPLLILAIAAGTAHLFMYVIPKFSTQLYSAYAENLVTMYVIADFVFIIAAITGLFIAGARDIFGSAWQFPSFDWIRGRSYIPVPIEVKEKDPGRGRSDRNDDV